MNAIKKHIFARKCAFFIIELSQNSQGNFFRHNKNHDNINQDGCANAEYCQNRPQNSDEGNINAKVLGNAATHTK